MSEPTRLTEQEQEELIAFLDGELDSERSEAIERRLSQDSRYRSEADSLKRTWELLDFLPRSEATPSFTERTLSCAGVAVQPVVVRVGSSSQSRIRVATWGSSPMALGLGWLAILLVAGWFGYQSFAWITSREVGDAELLRDLRVIENKRHYELIEDVRFLEQLDHPDLFGDDSGG